MKKHTPVIASLCATLFLSACGRDPATPGIKALQEGDLIRAEQLLSQALQQDPENASALMNLGIVKLHKGERDGAMTAFGKVADLAPGDPRPLEYLAALLADGGDWRDAGAMLAEAAQRAPNSVSVLTAQALVDLNVDGVQAARNRLLQAIALDPTYPPALFNLAVLYRDWLKSPGEGKRYFQRYLAVEKNDPHTTIARAALSEQTRLATAPRRELPAPAASPAKNNRASRDLQKGTAVPR